MENEGKRILKPCRRHAALLYLMAFMLLGYVLIHDLFGGTLFAHSSWDSYTLQAMAWRSGRAALSGNYSWLELAIYKGEYYVSFPPFPSVVLLPFTFIFGENTPNNLIIAVITLVTAALVYRACSSKGMRDVDAAIAALFVTWGTNLMWMSTNGGVWFMAQAINMLLLMGALNAAIDNRRALAYALVALAVGCRPFSLVAFLPLFIGFYRKDRQEHGGPFFKLALRQWKCLIAPLAIAGAYMWYNYIRFDSVLEFGHNYLPEFTEAENGQFNLTYILANLKNIFFRPIWFNEKLGLAYPEFDGFLFYVANPFFLALFVRIFKDIRHRRMDMVRLALLFSMAANLVMLSAHKTFGGWQFGARYTVDLVPLALAYMLLGQPWELSRFEKALACFGVMFNVYGALAMHFLYA